MKRKSKKFEYAFSVSVEKLKLFIKLTSEERFKWLEDSHKFLRDLVPYEKIKKWKLYIKKEELWKKEDLK
jgi:hypothetical protein